MWTNKSPIHADMKQPKNNAKKWFSNKMPLAHCLEKLKNQDTRCVMTIRKINKLGFKSAAILERHYSQYGEVIQAHVPHSEKVVDKRFRPGNMALVVMGSVDAAETVFAEGIVQIVSNVEAHVHRFELEKMIAKAKDAEEERYQHCVAVMVGHWLALNLLNAQGIYEYEDLRAMSLHCTVDVKFFRLCSCCCLAPYPQTGLLRCVKCNWVYLA